MSPSKLKGRSTLAVDGFLEELEKDELKKKTDLAALFQSFGIDLTKKGASYMGRCPFHDDKNPSLSVDPVKGLYHCFGCGESGDAIDLVRKIRNLSFREAVSYLKTEASAPVRILHVSSRPVSEAVIPVPVAAQAPVSSAEDATEIPSDAPPEVQAEAASPITEEPAPTPPAAVSVPLLDLVAEHYESLLIDSPEASRVARTYLEGRRLANPLALKRFHVGYSDGGLAEVLSAEQRDALAAKGLLKEDGSGGWREHFARCIVVPLYDEESHVSGFYGRRVDEGAAPAHLYLSGPHQGLANREAARVYRDRVILTEAVLDALSLEALGFHNAIPCYGVNGFTPLHEKLLSGERVAEVVIAFDADEAGRKGAAAVAERLAGLGIKAFIVKPPKVGEDSPGVSSPKDWNDYVVAGGTKDALDAALQAAEPAAPSAGAPTTASGLVVVKDKLATTFRSGQLSFRISGVKELFVSNLKVNIRASIEGSGEDTPDVFYDFLDLYSSRGRTSYAANVARLFELEPSRVERDLVAILEELEAERDRKLAGTKKERVVEVSPEDREMALAFLRNPRLEEEIVEDLSGLGCVGEDLNKLLMYLCASSRKLADPLSVIIISQSASGKSYLVDTVKKLMPPEDVIAVTSLSDQALNYIDDLKHKFLILGEAVHGDVVEHQIREMLSAKELARLVTLKDPETGRLASTIVRTPAVVASVMSTTNPHINPENASRCFVINTDESRGQTRRIHEAQRLKYSLERYKALKTVVPRLVAKHQAAQRLLKTVAIVNEFSRCLDFPDTLMRVRRDHDRFLDLIASVCFLRQYQKEEKRTEATSGSPGLSYIECDLEDYRIAHRIMVSGVLSSTMLDLPRGAQELYDSLRGLARKRALEEGLRVGEVHLSQREIREATGYGQSWVREHLRRLVEYEYVAIARGFGRGERAQYRVPSDEPMAALDMSMIPTPEAMAARVSRSEK